MAANVGEVPRSVVAFDEMVMTARVTPWVSLSHQLGGPIDEQAQLVRTLFTALRSIILTASNCSKPNDKDFAKLLSPLQSSIESIGNVKDRNRSTRDWFNHLSTVAEGVPAVGWITIDSKPGPYISEMKESAQFYANRLIKEFKDKSVSIRRSIHL